jgi:hypothetical protein
MIDDLWHKNAIFYCLNVGTFMNTENPAVREEIRKIMGLWLQLGVSAHALRLSARVTRLSPVAYGRRHPVGGGEYLAC